MLVIWQFGAFTFGGLGCKVGALGFRVWAFTFGGSGVECNGRQLFFRQGAAGAAVAPEPRQPRSASVVNAVLGGAFKAFENN